jgi:hypothetical protein
MGHSDVNRYARKLRLLLTLSLFLAAHCFAASFALEEVDQMVKTRMSLLEALPYFLVPYLSIQLIIWAIVAYLLLWRRARSLKPYSGIRVLPLGENLLLGRGKTRLTGIPDFLERHSLSLLNTGYGLGLVSGALLVALLIVRPKLNVFLLISLTIYAWANIILLLFGLFGFALSLNRISMDVSERFEEKYGKVSPRLSAQHR